jgi:hypothetical protein
VIFVLLSFAITTFLFGSRTLNSLFGEQKIKLRTKIAVETAFFLSWTLFGTTFAINFHSILIFCLIWHGFFLGMLKLSSVARERKFREETEAFFDRVILNLLAGNSFRSACLASSKLGEAFSQQELQKILSQVFYKHTTARKLQNSFTNLIVGELTSIDSVSHSALTRVRGLRRNLSLESEFRQKSEQVKGRIWIQGIFMLGLYLAILFFVSRQSERLDRFSLIVSVTFFVTGSIWTFMDGRKMKWKT